jgi:hypothetical protein
MPFSFLLLAVFSPITPAHAADSCLPQNNSITWNDLCDLSQPSPQGHMQAVNQQLDQVEGTSAPAKKPESVFAITPESSYIRYREPSLRVREQGDMFGVNLSYTYRPRVGSYLNSEISDMYRMEGRFSYGKVNYIGGLADGTPFNYNGIDDYMLEVRGLIGKDFDLPKLSTTLTPYWGFGYRSLFDSFSEAKPAGYNRWIEYFYLPLGGEVMTQLIDGWSIGADAEYDFLIHGEVTSYLGEIGFGDSQNPQRHGFGVKGSFKLMKKWGRFNLTMAPYIRYWHIRNSETQPSKPFYYQGQYYVLMGDEPNNNSTEIGAKLGIEF